MSATLTSSTNPGTSRFDLRTMVRARTQAIHDRLEELPLSRSIVDESVTREAYGSLLAQLLHVHRACEAHASQFPSLSAYATEAKRSHLIEADLAALGHPPAEPLPSTRRMLGALEQCAQAGSSAFLGALYVLVGSRMGGLVVKRHLATAFGLTLEPGQGLDYHVEGAKTFPRRWRALCAELHTHLRGRPAGLSFGKSAVATMQGFYDLYKELGANA